MAPQHLATMAYQQQRPQPQQEQQHQQHHRRRPKPTQTPLSHRCFCQTTRKPRSTFTVALALFLAVCCWCSSRHTATALPSSAPGGSSILTLRVRMPDGAVKRVQATAGETVDDIMGKLGMDGSESGEGLSTGATAGSGAAEGSASVAALGLRNGDFLYVKVRSASSPSSFLGKAQR